jgi:hypothetical protein
MVTAGAAAAPVMAQSVAPGPPGPYAFDARGITIGMPSAPAFYPALPAATLVPGRGFGADVGGHLYVLRLGPAELGVGANIVWARGTASTPPSAAGPSTAAPPPDARATLVIVAPQISLNFGTADGWSYLSGGAGAARLETATSGPLESTSRKTGAVAAFNVGGGARWFMTPRVAVGFDLRLHWISGGRSRNGDPATPSSTVGSASAGLSFR